MNFVEEDRCPECGCVLLDIERSLFCPHCGWCEPVYVPTVCEDEV